MLPNNHDVGDIYLKIARNIKKYRLLNGMSQQDLAIKSGYSYAYIRRVEGPKCLKNFSIQTVSNIAKALGVDITALFEDNGIL